MPVSLGDFCSNAFEAEHYLIVRKDYGMSREDRGLAPRDDTVSRQDGGSKHEPSDSSIDIGDFSGPKWTGRLTHSSFTLLQKLTID